MMRSDRDRVRGGDGDGRRRDWDRRREDDIYQDPRLRYSHLDQDDDWDGRRNDRIDGRMEWNYDYPKHSRDIGRGNPPPTLLPGQIDTFYPVYDDPRLHRRGGKDFERNLELTRAAAQRAGREAPKHDQPQQRQQQDSSAERPAPAPAPSQEPSHISVTAYGEASPAKRDSKPSGAAAAAAAAAATTTTTTPVTTNAPTAAPTTTATTSQSSSSAQPTAAGRTPAWYAPPPGNSERRIPAWTSLEGVRIILKEDKTRLEKARVEQVRKSKSTSGPRIPAWAANSPQNQINEIDAALERIDKSLVENKKRMQEKAQAKAQQAQAQQAQAQQAQAQQAQAQQAQAPPRSTREAYTIPVAKPAKEQHVPPTLPRTSASSSKRVPTAPMVVDESTAPPAAAAKRASKKTVETPRAPPPPVEPIAPPMRSMGTGTETPALAAIPTQPRAQQHFTTGGFTAINHPNRAHEQPPPPAATAIPTVMPTAKEHGSIAPIPTSKADENPASYDTFPHRPALRQLAPAPAKGATTSDTLRRPAAPEAAKVSTIKKKRSSLSSVFMPPRRTASSSTRQKSSPNPISSATLDGSRQSSSDRNTSSTPMSRDNGNQGTRPIKSSALASNMETLDGTPTPAARERHNAASRQVLADAQLPSTETGTYGMGRIYESPGLLVSDRSREPSAMFMGGDDDGMWSDNSLFNEKPATKPKGKGVDRGSADVAGGSGSTSGPKATKKAEKAKKKADTSQGAPKKTERPMMMNNKPVYLEVNTSEEDYSNDSSSGDLLPRERLPRAAKPVREGSVQPEIDEAEGRRGERLFSLSNPWESELEHDGKKKKKKKKTVADTPKERTPKSRRAGSQTATVGGVAKRTKTKKTTVVLSDDDDDDDDNEDRRKKRARSGSESSDDDVERHRHKRKSAAKRTPKRATTTSGATVTVSSDSDPENTFINAHGKKIKLNIDAMVAKGLVKVKEPRSSNSTPGRSTTRRTESPRDRGGSKSTPSKPGSRVSSLFSRK